MKCDFESQEYKSGDRPTVCNPNQTLASTPFSNNFAKRVPLVVDAVYAFAHALHSILEECEKNTSQRCVSRNKISGKRLLELIRTQDYLSPTGNVVNFTEQGDLIGRLPWLLSITQLHPIIDRCSL